MIPSHEGYFPVTANFDWCEPNYTYSFYVAEFWNALSSISMLFYGVFGFTMAQGVAPRAVLQMYFWLGVVGVGSTAFHGTLLRESQVLDELPMLYAVLSCCYVVAPGSGPEKAGRLVPLLVGLGLVITALYYVFHNTPYPQHLAFIVGILYLSYKALLIDREWRDVAFRQIMVVSGVCGVLAGVCWILDHELCEYVQEYHLHSWWHFLAGTACYLFIVNLDYYRAEKNGRSPVVRFVGLLPFVHYRG